MSEQIRLLLQRWKLSVDNRKKMQSAYLAFAFIGIVIAGIISLIDADTGRTMSIIALAFAAVFITNAVMWYLIVENVQEKIQVPKKPSKK